MEKNINTLFSIFDTQKNFATTSGDFSTKNITSKLSHLLDVFKKYEKELLTYLNKVYNKPYWDIYKTDTLLIKREIKYFIRNINKYRKLKNMNSIPSILTYAKTYEVHRPYGCCLMLINDLFPLSKVFIPIIGALACGNTLFIKLPNYENNVNKIIKTIIKEVFNDNFVYFLNENISDQEFKNVLDFNFDLVFYSGDNAGGKNIIKTFSGRTVKLITDIYSKCPLVVDETADLEKVAKQIVWAKMFNAGQTTLSPYYLIIHESVVKTFLNHLKVEYEKQYPQNNRWQTFTKISSNKEFDNISLTLNKALQKNKVMFGGEVKQDENKIELTLISVDDLKSPILSQDLYSPILPVVIFNSFSDVNGIVKHYDNPSAIYIYSRNKKRIKMLSNELESRYFYINDLTIPYFKKYWYGGIMNSGSNIYGCKESVKIFSYKRLIFKNSSSFANQRFKEFNKKENKIKNKFSIVK